MFLRQRPSNSRQPRALPPPPRHILHASSKIVSSNLRARRRSNIDARAEPELPSRGWCCGGLQFREVNENPGAENRRSRLRLIPATRTGQVTLTLEPE